MDTATAKFLSTMKIPDEVSFKIMDFSRPTSLPVDYKDEIEMMGTFRTFKNLSNECDREWEEYYKAWNSRRLPGYRYPDEEDISPPHMWNLIKYEIVQEDKNVAQHYIKNLEMICESPELLEKVSNYERVVWDYEFNTCKYKKVTQIYPAMETMKDLVSYIDCLRTCIENIEKAESHQKFRDQFETEEEYENALYEEELEYYNNLPYDPADMYD